MTGFLAILSGFILTPKIENVVITPREKTVIMNMIAISKIEDSCSITGPIGQTKSIIVLGTACIDKDGIFYRGRIGIDYKNMLWMKKRFYSAQWR